ncbi:ABC transporter permease [Sanguibacter sp. HDW7]|uniref:ABC transporter permease n=1 Tax=Sanguibacter sp. HDW7 TaxID=2714931 RepID=UPI00140A7B0D|nr:FtsX-like permease family protein [Sanguibacter sp. HDW7]QIK84664.1 hypothetical protein G7063_14360 [Sanguibacter sp. HDW7]
MSALLRLSWRLARAGGWFRLGATVLANVIGGITVVLLAALPDAFSSPYANTEDEPSVLPVLVGATFFLVPVAVLLLTVGRLSSETRDRRLASLRVLGLSPARTRLVAVGENVGAALVGTLLGAGATLAVLPAIGRWGVSEGWLVEPLVVSVPTAVVGVLGVVALSGVLAAAGTTRRTGDPRAARAISARRTPVPWSLVPLAAGAGMLLYVAHGAPEGENVRNETGWFLAGSLLCAVAVAFVPALLSSWAAALLARAPWTSTRLAARTIQTEPRGAARLVAGVGVVILLASAALGGLGAALSTPEFLDAQRNETTGPRQDWIRGAGAAPGAAEREIWSESEDLRPLTDAEVAQLAALPGVRSVLRVARSTDLLCDDGTYCGEVFVGTCDQLAAIASVTGCDDARVSRIALSRTTGLGAATGPATSRITLLGDPPEGSGDALPPALAEGVVDVPEGTPRTDVAVDGPDILLDVDAQEASWVYGPAASFFVPESLVADEVGWRTSGRIVIDGGRVVAEKVQSAASALGVAIAFYPDDDYTAGMKVRAAVLSGIAIVVGIVLVGFLLAAVDRTRERRRATGRLVATGVPPGVLRRAQLWQVGLPLALAALLGAGCGRLLTDAYLAIGNADGFGGAEVYAQDWLVGGLVVACVGVLAVAVASARVRLTPDLLRAE